MRTLILGDLHGRFSELKKVINKRGNDYDRILIVGDIGIGFLGGEEKPPFKSDIPIEFIRGNHDNPEVIRNLPNSWEENNWFYIPDGTIKDGVLYIGGAYSPDWRWRTPGVDWWFDEQLNDEEQEDIEFAIRRFESEIHTVVSHDAPHSLWPSLGLPGERETQTSWFLEMLMRDVLLENKKPVNWFFGHHHKNFSAVKNDINFRCVNVIESKDFVDFYK